MNFKTTIILFIVLAGIGAYLFLSRPSNPPAGQTPQNPSASDTRLIDLDPAAVQRIVIAPADGPRIVLNRSGNNWQLLEPVAAPADAIKVNFLIQALTALQSTAQIAADQKSAAGLDHPTYTVELTGPAGKVTTIAFGNHQIIGGALDVLVTGRDKPDVISNAIYTHLEQPASAYRQTKLVTVGAKQIQRIRIVGEGQRDIELTKSGDHWTTATFPSAAAWQSPAEVTFNADSASVGDMTVAIAGLTASGFVDEQHPLSSFGLAPPSLYVWFSTAPPSTQPGNSLHGTTLSFGRPVDVTKAEIYALIDGEIVTLPASTEEIFDKSALDLRDKQLLDIDPETVTSITIQADKIVPTTRPLPYAPKWTITLEREQAPHVTGPSSPTSGPASRPAKVPDSHWHLASGMRGADAHDAPVNALLQIFQPLTVQKYIEPPAATTQPASTYIITIKTTTNHTEVIKLTDPGGDSPLIGSSSDATFELDRALLAKINGPF